MTYIFESISMISLVIDYGKVELTSFAVLWSESSGLLAILSLALMSTVSVDQFSLLSGKFKNSSIGASADKSLVKQPIIQLLKYQFLGSTERERKYLAGANEIGSFQFLIYNMCSVFIWLAVIFLAGTALRATWTQYFGRFGPVEFEIITGILAVYIFGLGALILFKNKSGI